MSSIHPSKSDSKEHSTIPVAPVWNKNPDWDMAAAQEEALALYETCHEFELPGDSK